MKKHLQNDHIKEFNKYKAKVKAKDGRVVEHQEYKKQRVYHLRQSLIFLVVAQVILRNIMFN
jgi:hypothetical protein